jgi:hypothetical protein
MTPRARPKTSTLMPWSHPRNCVCTMCRLRRRAAFRSVVHAEVRCPTCDVAVRTMATLLTHSVYCEERDRAPTDAAIDRDAPRLRRQRRG